MPLLSQLLGGTGAGLGGIFGGGLPLAQGFTQRPVGSPFFKTLVYHDFTGIATTDQTVTAGKWNTIGYYTIAAQQFATWGKLTKLDHPDNQGAAFIDTEDTGGTDIDGWIRLVLANAQETQVITVLEERTEKLSENPTDPTKWLRLPQYTIIGGEDSKLMIQMKPDSSGTVDSGETIIYLDATVWQ